MTQPLIVLVDDSVAARAYLKKLLQPLDPKVLLATNGKEGLELALTEPVDAVVTDVHMPELNGLDFCKALKKTKDGRRVPVIMVSDFSGPVDINQGFEAGADAYVAKTEAEDQLLNTVRKILSQVPQDRDRTVLVVDDSKAIRAVVEKGLVKAGFNVVTAENPKIAMKILRNRKPDLILSDITMPEMDGFEFCKRVKADPDLAGIPFLVMSTNNDRTHMKRMIQYGAASYIIKPFNLDQLVILVEKMLSDHFLNLIKDRERLETERAMMLATITSLISALEARDTYTRGHSDAVADIIASLAELSGAEAGETEIVHLGGKLHDIGKIGVPDNILLKPGKLTGDEFQEIKKHPVTGLHILNTIPSLEPILPIVHHHHERWDGKGYPAGLKGEKIPFWARLTAVADTYHALTSDRPYRRGMPAQKALKIIDDVSGTQLCPQSVELFFNWHENAAAPSEVDGV